MAKYTVEYLPAAEDDLTSIFDYIAGDNSNAANGLLDEIDKFIHNQETFPEMGVIPKNRRLANKGYRILIAGDYLVFYRLLGAAVRIMRILYGKRKYANIL